jgi:C4-dicarboxylate-specific signal transduction histidine kinase
LEADAKAPSNRELRFDPHRLHVELPATTADRVQLQQVLMNLMLDGIEAMKNTGGELAVTSKNTEANKGRGSHCPTGATP